MVFMMTHTTTTAKQSSSNRRMADIAPHDYLNTDSLVTFFDGMGTNSGLAAKQYHEGKLIGMLCDHVSIGYNGCWSATMKDGSHLSSYEKIGYHACTADLMRGFIESGCAIFVYRFGTKWDGKTKIQ